MADDYLAPHSLSSKAPDITTQEEPLPRLRLRPPRNTRPLSGMRYTCLRLSQQMKRRLLNLLTLLSLALCVAVAGTGIISLVLVVVSVAGTRPHSGHRLRRAPPSCGVARRS